MKTLILLLSFTLTLASISNAQTDKKIYAETELETKPVFAEGKMTLNDFLNFYQKQPEQNSGSVALTLILSAQGDIINSAVTKSLTPALDKEALRLAELMPRFTPALKNGKKVSSRITLNIPFNEKKFISENSTAVNSTPSSSVSKIKNPLYVIDGKIVNEDINVNADNIESVRVLKGAKAVARYGERATDGVIIFKTKNTTQK